jgi:hypothetical protein
VKPEPVGQLSVEPFLVVEDTGKGNGFGTAVEWQNNGSPSIAETHATFGL